MRLREKVSPYVQQDRRLDLMWEVGAWTLMAVVITVILAVFWIILDIKHTRENQRWPLCVMPPGGSAQSDALSPRRSPTL